MSDASTPATAPETPQAAPNAPEQTPTAATTGASGDATPNPGQEQVRRLRSHFTATVRSPADLMISVCVSREVPVAEESFTFTVDGVDVDTEQLDGNHGTRWHIAREVPTGELEVTYEARVVGREPQAAATPVDLMEYLWPSRYCDSDRLAHRAQVAFGGLAGRELLDAVVSSVRDRIAYVVGSSRVVDGASDTFLQGSGVCRDFAHLVIAMLRARGVPARLVSVYAPGLSPMDFHAVVEAWVEGRWCLVDATGLAPRESMVRIATGRDAADTAFLTVTRGQVDFGAVEVTATVEPGLPVEDPAKLVELG